MKLFSNGKDADGLGALSAEIGKLRASIHMAINTLAPMRFAGEARIRLIEANHMLRRANEMIDRGDGNPFAPDPDATERRFKEVDVRDQVVNLRGHLVEVSSRIIDVMYKLQIKGGVAFKVMIEQALAGVVMAEAHLLHHLAHMMPAPKTKKKEE